jgi:hypothetical protein
VIGDETIGNLRYARDDIEYRLNCFKCVPWNLLLLFNCKLATLFDRFNAVDFLEDPC